MVLKKSFLYEPPDNVIGASDNVSDKMYSYGDRPYPLQENTASAVRKTGRDFPEKYTIPAEKMSGGASIGHRRS